jgi:hypothetical protein
MSCKKVININLNNCAVIDLLSTNGFSYNDIVKTINNPTNSWGFYGSSIFEILSNTFNNDSSKWLSKPGDIDLCVTDLKTFKNLITYFENTNKYFVHEQPDKKSDYSSMGNVLKVCNILLKNCNKHIIPLQIVYVNTKNIIQHLRTVDFGITKVAFNTNGYILVDEAFEQLIAKKTIFPNKFKNATSFVKTMKRYFKYFNRNVEFEMPDIIELESKNNNRHLLGYIYANFGSKYIFGDNNTLYKIKKNETNQTQNDIETLKKLNENLQKELVKKNEDFEAFKKKIKGFIF